MKGHHKTLSLRSLLLITIFLVTMLLIGYEILYELISDVFTTPPVVDDIKDWESFVKNP